MLYSIYFLFNLKKGSISWECLPFTSKKANKNTKNGKKSKNEQQGAINTYQTSKTENSLDKITDRSSEDDAYESMSSSKLKQNPKKVTGSPKPASAVKQHQPYAAHLINNGFGFGFDLQGGDTDNQLTFIVNVQSNGDAARKGLSDGKCLYSFLPTFL